MTLPAEPEDKPAKPGILDRLRARYGWFDHVMRAQERYQDSKGDFYAAGITYFTVFAIFPLLMVGFAIRRLRARAVSPTCSPRSRSRSSRLCPATSASSWSNLMESAIESRTSVGIIGLATAAWAGLGWMANLREALTQMWGLMRHDPPGFRSHQAVRSDRHAVGLFAAIVDHHRADCAGQCRT